MDHLECPSFDVWEARRHWFERLNETAADQGSYLLSEHACALTVEVQAVFCAGAWAAVIVLAMTVIDAQLREIAAPDFRGDTQKLIARTMQDPALQVLRRRRNALVHVNPDQPAITVDQQSLSRSELEAEAREAIRLMLAVLYDEPGT